MSDLTIALKDGRKIGYIEYGDRNGIPVFFFHGTPGSRLMFLVDDEISKNLGIRLICLDRPGFGISDPKPNRTILDWADDVQEVADYLNIVKFSVIGISGGGAYAAACAYKLADRLHSAAMVSSVAPFMNGKPPKSMMKANRIAFFLAKHAPWLMKASYKAQKKLLEQQPEKFMKETSKGNKHLNEWDRQFLQTDDQVKSFMMHFGEAIRMSVDECVNEPVLMAKPWGFSVSDIQIPVDVWHGENDTMAPIEEMKNITPTIPNAQTHYIPGAGHFLVDDEETYKNILSTIIKRSQVNAIGSIRKLV
jgi:pimeloyl-ACP methyl ester carboxylesterase